MTRLAVDSLIRPARILKSRLSWPDQRTPRHRSTYTMRGIQWVEVHCCHHLCPTGSRIYCTVASKPALPPTHLFKSRSHRTNRTQMLHPVPWPRHLLLIPNLPIIILILHEKMLSSSIDEPCSAILLPLRPARTASRHQITGW